MFTETDTGTLFSIEIPIEVSTFWFFGALAVFGLVVAAPPFVINYLIPRIRKEWKEESSAKKSFLTRFFQWMYAENAGLHFVKWLALFAAPFWVFFIGLILRNFAQLGLNPPTGEDTDPRAYYFAIAGTVALLGGLVAAPLALLRLQTVERQTTAQEEGLLTDRINKAVEGLGAERTVSRIGRIARYQIEQEWSSVFQWSNQFGESEDLSAAPDDFDDIDFGDWQNFNQTEPNLEVRIGSIYALERIARDNLEVHIQIMEILCAYIRGNFPAVSLEPTDPPFERKKPRADLQALVDVIGRRSNAQIALEAKERYRLKLDSSDLAGVRFSKGNFSAADFSKCNLEAAIFRQSRLDGAYMFSSLLNFADFFDAKMIGTRLDRATYNLPEDWGFGGPGDLSLAYYFGISISGADMRAIQHIPKDKKHLVFGSKDTQLRYEMRQNQQSLTKTQYAISELEKEGKMKEAAVLRNEFNEEGYIDWFAYDSGDGALGHYHHKFLDRLGLDGWPYR